MTLDSGFSIWTASPTSSAFPPPPFPPSSSFFFWVIFLIKQLSLLPEAQAGNPCLTLDAYILLSPHPLTSGQDLPIPLSCCDPEHFWQYPLAQKYLLDHSPERGLHPSLYTRARRDPLFSTSEHQFWTIRVRRLYGPLA